MTTTQQVLIAPVTVDKKVASSGTDTSLKSIAVNFFDTLKSLIKDYADPDKDMVIDGVPLPHDLKYGALGTLMIGRKTSDLESMFTSSFNIYNAMVDMEKKLTSTT